MKLTTKIKNAWNKYYAPTPRRWRQIGDAMLYGFSTMSSYEIVKDRHWLAISFIAIGLLGKLITNLASEEGG